jgi:kynurenine formamidase
MALIDLSHTITHGLATYPGLPSPVIRDYLSREASRALYEPGTSFHISKIEMVANTGTYVDAPFHRFDEGADVSELPLERLADLRGFVVRARDVDARALGPELFEEAAAEGVAVLVDTGWCTRFGTPAYFEPHPYLTADAAQLLADRRVAFVGIDSVNIDDREDPLRPAHTTLLRARIPICEHMNALDALPDYGFRLHAVPVKVRGMGTFPVRAYAVVPD